MRDQIALCGWSEGGRPGNLAPIVGPRCERRIASICIIGLPGVKPVWVAKG